MLGILMFWIILIAGGALMVFLSKGKRGEAPGEILKRRYARGEINKEDYERQLRELHGQALIARRGVRSSSLPLQQPSLRPPHLRHEYCFI